MQEVEKERNMKGYLKEFDIGEYNRYDSRGKSAVMAYLNRKTPFKTIENPDPYGIDLLSLNLNDEVVHCWEVEVRHGNWRGDTPFPFNEINCIERKDHQWRRDKTFTDRIPYKLADNYKVWYAQLNKECTRMVLIDGDTVLQYPLKQWRNRKAAGEYVRQVPVEFTLQKRLNVIEAHEVKGVYDNER